MTLVRHTNEHNIARPSSPLAEAFARHGVRMTFHRNEEIFAQDDPVERLYRVARGVVRTSRVNADGRRQVGDFYYVGDVFGLEPGPLHRFGGEALEDCEIVVVRRSTVRAELDQAILEAQRVEMERLRSYSIAHDCGFVLDARVRPATGGPDRWMRLIGAPVSEDGRLVRLHGLKLWL